MNNLLSDIFKASQTVFSSQKYQVLGLISFATFLVVYAFVLPATYTGGRVGLVSLKFINPTLGLFALVFSFCIALILAFSTWLYSKRRNNQKNSSAVGSLFGSILPPLLCCSPFLPTLAALIVGVFPFAFGISGFTQGFIATYEIQIFSLMVVILFLSLSRNAKQVMNTANGVCDLKKVN